MDQLTVQQPVTQRPRVDEVSNLSRELFYQNYVAQNKPVIIKDMARDWKALAWDATYFREKEVGLKFAVKKGNVSEGIREQIALSDYIDQLEQYEEILHQGGVAENPGYLHDVPFFHLYPNLIPDIEPFPVDFFPQWYSENWHNYIQFFMGPTGSLTPLHFDTLCTHNLFFQIVGTKKFLLISAEQKDLCYLHGWRWAKFNPDAPDYDRFPLAREAVIQEATVGPGDILYIPPGMLHQVHGLSYSISFNIDWHTPESVSRAVLTGFQGAPMKNTFYNSLLYLGVKWGVPAKHLFKYYKSYLSYVS